MSDVIKIKEKNAEKLRKTTIELERQNNGAVKTLSLIHI